MFFRKNRIPPPLNPIIPQDEEDEFGLPYSIAEQPRTFLYFLANNTRIDEDGKALIREWLEKYDHLLYEYLLGLYGPWGVAWANEIAAHVSTQFYAAAKGAVDEAEREFFQRLEGEMGDGSTDSI